MQTKVIKEFFTIADFLEEEKFLEKQHQEGWKLLKLDGLTKYVFEECPKEEYVYQLDFIEEKKDEAAYIQMFQDYGWEYVMKFRNWYYFRKVKTSVSSDNHIFSDMESKVKMIHKVYRRNLIILPICSLILPVYWALFILPIKDEVFILVTGGIYLVMMIFIINHIARIFIKLKKLMNQERNGFVN